MSQFSQGTYCTIVAVDVADSTDPRRTVPHKLAMHTGLYDILRQAFAEADIPLGDCTVADRGDGALIFVPLTFPRSRIADRLLDRIHVGLLRHNAVYSEEARIQLRLSAHAGEVYFDTNGQVGPDIEFACRILDADDAKQTLRVSGGPLAVILSEEFYRSVIVRDPGTAPGLYRQIAVAVKRTRDVAWLRVFGPSGLPTNHSKVLPVLAEVELDELRALLGDVTVPRIGRLVAAAAGRAVPPVRHGETPFGAVRYLLDYNSNGDGIPPALTFVELLSYEVDEPLATALAKWTDKQVAQLGRAAPPRKRPAPPRRSTADHLYLEVAVEHDGIDAEHFLVSQWRKEHGAEWLTRPDDTQQVHETDLQAEVDRLVMDAETAWANNDGCAVVIEFIVPRDLLTIPFDEWFKERESAQPRPLSLDYLIVLRSLERMQKKHWHRVWRNRWRLLREDPSNSAIYMPNSAEVRKPYILELDLTDERYVGMTLSTPPTADPQPGDELSAALRSGLPVIMWTRTPGTAQAARDFVTRLEQSGTLLDLPMAVLSARQAALAAADTSAEIAATDDRIVTIVLLWDDPYRMVAVDQLTPWQLERNTVNER